MLVAGVPAGANTSVGAAQTEHAERSPRSPVRLLTVTTLFPNASAPRHGIFVANRLARLRETGRIEASVTAAVPWLPGVYSATGRIPGAETILGMPVRHPRYVHVPAISMRTQPRSLARALLDDLRRSGMGARDFDVVDAHYFYPDGVAAARVAEALKLPLVISARGSDINLIGGIDFARRRMLEAAERAQALIAVSRALAERMVSLGMPAERIHVLRNGVDGRVFAPVPQQDARRRLALACDARWVLGVGNLVSEKGFDLLVRAVARIDGARLLLVGEGPLRRRLEALVGAVAPGRVAFRPNMPQSELRVAYSAADVLGLPSIREGWPNVLLESLACGTPVVASSVGGIPEILAGDAPGLIVSERSPEAWARALSLLLDAPRQADDARQYALRFGWSEVVDAQCALYERVAGASTAPIGRAGFNAAGGPA